ncbi:heterokaryon incompatibility protein-domain-containing protein [Daldinia vernicosa]|uniref:heterokaryon incompatibility protein-domain-containing protein n=1 Tax=Daldinia vernicosa TaxID=114800 RepID=UPI0020075D39|nr:heterokaryon incompatibility protein-domain-containing protein [Daldinia vernicosa]KAI0845118.1 heterokaryon incompatibility protein-domain-containing protein [Daldinia vernicosa]
MATNSESNSPSSKARIYAPLGPNQARFIEILPSDDDDQSVSCLLRTAELTPDLHYAALSYVWGDPKVTRDILVNGHILPVTTNLACALWYFRKGGFPRHDNTEKIRLLWVDAICINQEDTPERSHQVTLMGTIFGNASSVFSWLEDPGLRHLDAVFPVIREFLSMVGSISQPRNRDADERHTGMGRAILDWLVSEPERLKPLAKLSRCTYWTRIWIVQEMALAKSPVEHWFICGHDSITFREIALFDAAILNIFGLFLCSEINISTVMRRMLWRVVHMMVQDVIEKILFAVEDEMGIMRIDGKDKFVNSYIERASSVPPMLSQLNLETIINKHNLSDSVFLFGKIAVVGLHTSATDPRDMVYAVLSIVSSDIIPDYTKSVRDVYLDALLRDAMEDTVGAYLQFSGLGHNMENEHDLPSWLPDLTKSTSWHDPSFKIGQLSRPKLLEGVRLREPEMVNRGILLIQGAACGSIKHIKRIPRLCREFGKMIYQLCIDYLVDWVIPGETTTGIRQIMFKRPLQALLTALCWDGLNDDVSHFEDSRGIHLPRLSWTFLNILLFGGNVLSEDERRDARRRLKLPWGVRLEGFMANCFVDVRRVVYRSCDNWEQFNFLVRRVEGNAVLFQTYDGRLGSGPSGTKLGDIVCAVDGTPSPILLRKDKLQENGSSHLVHVGVCFVVGLLDEKPAEMVKRGELEIETFEIH